MSLLTPEQAGKVIEEVVSLPPIPDDVAKLVDWIPRRRYRQLYGETDAVINNRIAREQWTLGVEYSRPEGGGTWISIKGVNAWAARGASE